MSRSIPIALIVVLTLGCRESTAPTLAPTRPSLSVTQNDQRIEIIEDAVFPVPRGCTGEPVAWSLRQEAVLHEVTDANGGFHGSFHFHDKGSSGVGLVSGAQYRLAQQQDEHFETRSGAPEEDTAIFLRRFISQGSLPNFRVTSIFHYTIDANGNLTSFKNTSERICN